MTMGRTFLCALATAAAVLAAATPAHAETDCIIREFRTAKGVYQREPVEPTTEFVVEYDRVHAFVRLDCARADPDRPAFTLRWIANGRVVRTRDLYAGGLALGRGANIARRAGDDVGLPERLERQVAFMQANPRVGICGAWVQKIGELGYGVEHYPSDDADIRCHLLFANVLAHPAAIMRRSLFAELGLAYDSSYQRAQDYDLWVRAAEHVALANIPQVLLRYRMHRDQAGQREQEDQHRAAMLVRRRLLERLGLQPSVAELALHQAISASRFQPTRELVAAAERWLRALAEANRRAGRYDKAALARLLAARWYTLCRLSTALGPWVWRIYRRSPLRRPAPVGWPRLIKFALKCMARSPSL